MFLFILLVVGKLLSRIYFFVLKLQFAFVSILMKFEFILSVIRQYMFCMLLLRMYIFVFVCNRNLNTDDLLNCILRWRVVRFLFVCVFSLILYFIRYLIICRWSLFVVICKVFFLLIVLQDKYGFLSDISFKMGKCLQLVVVWSIFYLLLLYIMVFFLYCNSVQYILICSKYVVVQRGVNLFRCVLFILVLDFKRSLVIFLFLNIVVQCKVVCLLLFFIFIFLKLLRRSFKKVRCFFDVVICIGSFC